MSKGEKMNKIIVKERASGNILASGTPPTDVIEFEGNLYFDEKSVEMERLVVTPRTYTCPYKGVCYWIDLEAPEGKVTNVGWVYREPKTGYENIKNRIAFYQGSRPGTVSETA